MYFFTDRKVLNYNTLSLTLKNKLPKKAYILLSLIEKILVDKYITSLPPEEVRIKDFSNLKYFEGDTKLVNEVILSLINKKAVDRYILNKLTKLMKYFNN